jgi:hypothetical protein
MSHLFFTKIAGTTSGPLAQKRQNALKFLHKAIGLDWYPDDCQVRLHLVPEPDNEHDPYAIKVMLGTFHLGYIPNSNTYCTDCEGEVDRFPQNGKCPKCYSPSLIRKGTATRLSEIMGEIDGIYYALVTEITGGQDGKSFGCNLEIRRSD